MKWSILFVTLYGHKEYHKIYKIFTDGPVRSPYCTDQEIMARTLILVDSVNTLHEGKWYLGNVVRNGHRGWVKNWSWRNSHEADWVVCGAFNDDGEFMEAQIHQRYTRPESDGGRRSQYLVQVPGDDGSKWTDWTEWSECSATCGNHLNGDAVRTRSRKCLDKDGNEIEPKTGVNCLPD